ncbi:hypothetical protein MTsPCn9_10390 [Croceitalea sp. MTPC9]|uniref:BfmA/BtgA family mobilization protein n=1 Tax=unclassified Croceitalea TaxID=2632280 RepID=UPI002B3EF529|nr:hypothetical protein MTsPCn6_26850 [Croceitalea sp. MTPC6]GMN16103.1 hypothetical protein MTsPCn9_10390 [Croceitalea sp. MTPC9]
MGANVNIKVSGAVAEKFRGLSPKIAKTHSEALALLMDTYAQVGSHKKDFRSHPVVKLLMAQGDQNTDRIISINRATEKDKIDRILSILLVLFDHGAKRKHPQKPSLESINSAPSQDIDTSGPGFALIELQEEKLKVQDRLVLMQREIHGLLHEKAQLVRPLLGKVHVKLFISGEEFKALKQRYKND